MTPCDSGPFAACYSSGDFSQQDAVTVTLPPP